MKRMQLTLDGQPHAASGKLRAGAIGKVQRCIESTPWLTVHEIAIAVGEPASRVSDALNKLKHEGNAQQREKVGPNGRSLWAGTSEAGRALRDATLPERLSDVAAIREEIATRKNAAKLGRLLQRAGLRAEEASA